MKMVGQFNTAMMAHLVRDKLLSDLHYNKFEEKNEAPMRETIKKMTELLSEYKMTI